MHEEMLETTLKPLGCDLPYLGAGFGPDLNVAVKADGNKSRVDLIDPEWLEGIGEVLKFGAIKYADHNWRKGFKYSRLIGACLRHLLAIMRREDIDPESGLPHVNHLSCSVMFLAWHLRHKKELDDRWK